MNRFCIGVVLAVLSLLAASGIASGEPTFAICFRPSQAEFQELELSGEIYEKLVGQPEMEVFLPERVDSVLRESPRLNLDSYEPDMLTDLAAQVGARYLIWLKVKKAGIEQANRTLIPYVFRSHHRRYVLGIQMFILDSYSGKTVLSEYFESHRSGPCALSYLDFDSNNPDLIQKYSVVKGEFEEMEQELSERISRRVVKTVLHR